MIKWINDTFGISNEVSVPTLISIIVFLTGGLVNFLFKQFNAFSNRKTNRKTFFLLLEYVILDIKIKEKNVSELKNQIEVTYEDGFSYIQKSITSLDSIFEFGFKEIFHSFRKKFIWSFGSRSLKYKAFHRIWDSFRELKYFESKIYDHLNNLTNDLNERIVNYNSSLRDFTESFTKSKVSSLNNEFSEADPMHLEYLQEEKAIWQNWQSFQGNKKHYYNSYKYLILPLISLNKKFPLLKISYIHMQQLLHCESDYEEIEYAIETNKILFLTYFKFYRNKKRLLEKCLDIIKS